MLESFWDFFFQVVLHPNSALNASVEQFSPSAHLPVFFTCLSEVTRLLELFTAINLLLQSLQSIQAPCLAFQSFMLAAAELTVLAGSVASS